MKEKRIQRSPLRRGSSGSTAEAAPRWVGMRSACKATPLDLLCKAPSKRVAADDESSEHGPKSKQLKMYRFVSNKK